MKNFYLEPLAEELAGALKKRTVKSISSPDDSFYLFSFEGGPPALFVSAKRSLSYVFLVPEALRREGRAAGSLTPAVEHLFSLREPAKAAREKGGPFLRTLERLFQGGMLLDVRREGDDRILKLAFQTKDPTGLAPPVCELVVELFPNAPDVIITEGGTGEILASFRKTKGEGEQRKEPGVVYEPPGRTLSGEEHKHPREETTKPAEGPYPISVRLLEEFRTAMAAAGLNEAAKPLRKLIMRRMQAKEKAISRIEAELKEAERAGTYKRWGEQLLSFPDKVERGRTSVSLRDYYSQGSDEIKIQLDPKITIKENALRLFKKAKKLERSLTVLPKRVLSLRKECDKLKHLLEGTETSKSIDELHEMREGMESELPRGLRQERKEEIRRGGEEKTKARKGERFSPRSFNLGGGWTVLVGRSSKENDYLTHVLAKKNDIWLHAAQVEGSHAVLRRSGSENPSNAVIAQAAKIAAYYSKARKSGTVLVAYTEKKNVRKPRKGKPGLALISHEKLIAVKPGLPEAAEKPS
ncbi:MAG: NFACT RNA binding domain-containing protein [Candidatus Eisenbacteria bacterium]|nr:NFACT RNA binding domain-containing protein [Candidatus Eisenbacteria bacterium]